MLLLLFRLGGGTAAVVVVIQEGYSEITAHDGGTSIRAAGGNHNKETSIRHATQDTRMRLTDLDT